MKKDLLKLCCALLMGVYGIQAGAQTKYYEPDTYYDNAADAVGKNVCIVNQAESKALVGRDAQNIVYDTYAKTLKSDVAVLWYHVEQDGENYLLRCVTPAGGDYGLWGHNPCYLNCQPAKTGVIFNLGLGSQKGVDHANGAVWRLIPVAGGFHIQNVGNGSYIEGVSTAEAPTKVWSLCATKEVVKVNPIPVPNRTATDALDLTSLLVGTKKENGQFTGRASMTWPSGIDLSQYRYLTVTLGQNTLETNAGSLRLVDNNGVAVEGDDYGVGNQNMWFGSWNHHYTCCIDLEKLRQDKFFNVYDIREFTINFGDGVLLNNIYASNVEAKTINRWGNPNDEGTYRNVADGLAAGTFGTVCLPYQASYAGAYIYSVVNCSNGSVALEQVEGLMEAGKPYFYCVNEAGNPAGAGVTRRVFFYKATAEEVSDPVVNQGMVGTFVDNGNVPNDMLVLSKNKMYKVNSTIPFIANHAYVDPTQAPQLGGGVKGLSLEIAGDLTTAVTSLQHENAVEGIYSADGARQLSLKKGLNVVKMQDGSVKKLMVK